MAHALLRPIKRTLANISPGPVDGPFQDVGSGDSNVPISLMRGSGDDLIDFEGGEKHDSMAISQLAHPKPDMNNNNERHGSSCDAKVIPCTRRSFVTLGPSVTAARNPLGNVRTVPLA